MVTTAYKPIHAAIRRSLFGFSLLLLCIAAAGYGYWKQNPLISLNAAASPEQTYYQQLVYAVNEMHNQVQQYDSQSAIGTLKLADISNGETYVKSLMAALTSPPEELTVSQAIAEDLFAAYQAYIDDLTNDASGSSVHSSREQVLRHFELFQQNANLITVLSAYKGVNVECH